MKMTGQILRENREKKGVTLSEVAMSTKINIKVIEAMENGDLENLPSKTFLRGFVQTYGGYLKIDSKSLMNTFMEEMGEKEAKAKQATLGAPTPEEPTKTSMPMPIDGNSSSIVQKLIIGVAVVAVVLIVKVLFKTVEKYEKEARTLSPSEIANTIKKGPEEIKEPEAEEKVSAVEKPVEKAPEKKEIEAEKPKEPAKKEESTPVATTPPPVEVKAPAAVKPEPVAAIAKVEEKKSEEKQEQNKKQIAAESGASIQTKELIIEALDNVEIVFSVDNAPAKRTRLETDKIHIIKADKVIKVDVSDGGAINVIFNGEDKGVPGAVGKPMQLSYP